MRAAADGSERANAQLFVGDLCELLDLPKPDPARDHAADGTGAHNAYVFEGKVPGPHRAHPQLAQEFFERVVRDLDRGPDPSPA